MKSLIHPTYFPSVAHFVILANDDVIFEVEDHYQKQTYRNRTYIYGPNGKQILPVPIRHTKTDGRQKYKDVIIENDFNWQKQHWKTLETAYRTSPFFEFFEDEIFPFFEKKHRFLMELNFESVELISKCISLGLEYEKTSTYTEKWPEETDYRQLVNAKSGIKYNFDPYIQVFEDKHGYLQNLSILDLLFNEGTNVLPYLESQKRNL